MITFKKLFTKDNDLRRVQDESALAFSQVSNMPWNGGVILKDVALLASSTDNKVEHGLGKVPQGFIILSKNATADIWNSSSSNSVPELVLILRSSAVVTVSIWIF